MMRHVARCALSLCALFIFNNTADAFECNVCHSKNPAMVRMHKATQSKDISCFDCHKVGEKLMGKGRSKDRESSLKRRTTDPICVACHNKVAAGKL